MNPAKYLCTYHPKITDEKTLDFSPSWTCQKSLFCFFLFVSFENINTILLGESSKKNISHQNNIWLFTFTCQKSTKPCKTVHLKKFFTHFKTMSHRGPCPIRPCPMRFCCIWIKKSVPYKSLHPKGQYIVHSRRQECKCFKTLKYLPKIILELFEILWKIDQWFQL